MGLDDAPTVLAGETYRQTMLGDNVSRLEIPGVTADDEGTYTCKVSNLAATTSSNPAFLYVAKGPIITKQPLNTIVDPGANATLYVEVEGTKPLLFQWRRNSVPIAGEE